MREERNLTPDAMAAALTPDLRSAAEALADVVEDFLFVKDGQDPVALRKAWQHYVDTAAREDG